MENFLAFRLDQLPFVAISLMIAFTLHELAHAYVAYKFGDPTAKNEGRLTLSPIAHLDPLGTLLIFLVGFGWARPVPVNRFYFKRPRLAGICVSIAGPVSNLLIALFALLAWETMLTTGLIESMSPKLGDFMYQLFNMLVSLNVMLFVFNLLPFPPLDGFRIVEDLVPNSIRPKLINLERWGSFVFIFLVITPLYSYTIGPIMTTVIPAVTRFLYAIVGLIFGY